MKRMAQDNVQRAAKSGERTGTTCPVCDEPVLRQEVVSSNGTRMGGRQVCSKRGCPWQRPDR
jgi:ribosome modulation factor